ncbi:hypothetical protein [Sporomusa sp.]|uniref:hypothetical protein n=1 Tax=Sporomusa sp. TaxID=2078658 RepID=UPI002CF329ED|nr:hypothetical protein [Sporomusa sp.]HWR09702.1 hypothetical protein [Sporomusa sp.]
MVKPCLLDDSEWDIKSWLRLGASKGDIAEYLQKNILNKPARYLGVNQEKPQRGMSGIGG